MNSTDYIMKQETIYVEENNKEYTIVVGQNAKENDAIIKQSSQNDIWFHLEISSSPHIILKSNGDNIPKKYLKHVALLLFQYKSKAHKQRVIYTEVHNVSLTKTPGSVITKNTKTLKV